MPISLQSTKALNNTVVGQVAYFSDTQEVILNTGDMVFLKSGYCSVGEAALYPEAYGKFDNFLTPVQSPFPNYSMNVTGQYGYSGAFVRYVNGMYIAGAGPASNTSGGLIATSTDGVNWAIVSRTRFNPNNINYLSGTYTMGAYDTTLSKYGLYTSTNLTTWTLVDSKYNTSSYQMYDSVVGNGLLVTVGYFGTIVTYNGTTATTRNPGSGSATLFSVTYGAGKFVVPASSGINYSADGITWTQVVPSGWATASTTYVSYGNGVFIVSTTSGGKWWRSTDGVSWTSFTMPAAVSGSYCSRYGFVYQLTTSTFATSLDGITWETVSIPVLFPVGSMGSNGTDIVMASSQTQYGIATTVPSVGLVKETSTGYGKLYMRIK